MSAVPLIPVAGGAAADEPDRLQCGRHREFEVRPPPASTAAHRTFEAERQAQVVQQPVGADGVLLPDSSRLTSLGRFLRVSSLDELPELMDVVRGEMSLVGPRPLLHRYTEYLSETERRRLDLLPGITGLAQVNGRNAVSWDERLAMDVFYVDNWSWRLDLRILAMTLVRVLVRRGAVADPGSAMQDLDVERQARHS